MEILNKIESILNYIFNILSITTGQNKEEKERQQRIKEQKFNHQLEKEKQTSFCDALRKEKQKQIEELKND